MRSLVPGLVLGLTLKGLVIAEAVLGGGLFQGKLAEVRNKINLSQTQAQNLQARSQAGLASPLDQRNLRGLQTQIPRYETAYSSLEKQASMKVGSGARTSSMAQGMKGALSSVGIYAGAQVLSDSISNNGEVNVGRALTPMLQPSFLMGIGGGAIGAMIMSRLPIPGIGGGLLKALPMFLGGAVGFEAGSGNLAQTNWTKLIASTTASALAFGLIGGPIGIGASILAGMAVDKLLADDPKQTPIMGYEPQWQMMSEPISVIQGFPVGQPLPGPQVQIPQPAPMPFPQQPALGQSVPAVAVPVNKTMVKPASPGEVEELRAKMSTHYENYIRLVKDRQGTGAKKEYDLYKQAKNRLQELGQ